MKRYRAYKRTGLEWLPEIPQEWKWKFLSQVAHEQTINKPVGEMYPIMTLSYGEIKKKKKIDSGLVPANYDTYQMLYKDNIVLRLIDLQNDHTSLRTGLVKETGIITSAYTCIMPTENAAYIHYLLHSYDIKKVFYSYGGGVRQSIGYKDIRYLQLPVPPRLEQDQIVRFLDWKVSRINKLISVKQKQLEEFKALVNKQFVQLSSQANKRVRLKYLVELDSDFIQIQDDCYYIKTGMYNRGRGIFRREAILGKNMGDSSFQKIHAGRVMVSGQFAWEAATYVTVAEDEIGVASHRYYLMNPTNGIPAEYIWCYLMTEYGQLQMKLCSHGAAGRNRPLNIKELLNVYIPIPNIGTELSILVRNVQNLMKLSIYLNNQEKILEELKSRLISDTVTGKVDIRDVEIPEYEFMDENISVDNESIGNEDEPPEEDWV